MTLKGLHQEVHDKVAGETHFGLRFLFRIDQLLSFVQEDVLKIIFTHPVVDSAFLTFLPKVVRTFL